MFKILIDNLIPTGIMNHLVEIHYTKSWKFQKPEVGPSTLKVNDLLFGFNIWFGFCLISTLAFVAELGLKLLKSRTSKRIKFIKIHPSKITSVQYQPNFIQNKSELVEIFRIKKREVEHNSSNIFETAAIEEKVQSMKM